jgi:hypothetical protein
VNSEKNTHSMLMGIFLCIASIIGWQAKWPHNGSKWLKISQDKDLNLHNED